MLDESILEDEPVPFQAYSLQYHRVSFHGPLLGVEMNGACFVYGDSREAGGGGVDAALEGRIRKDLTQANNPLFFFSPSFFLLCDFCGGSDFHMPL